MNMHKEEAGMETIRITNAKIVTPDEILVGYDLIIQDDTITDIVKSDVFKMGNARIGETPGSPDSSESHSSLLDADGGFLMPGFIDIHSDYIEHMAAPRPTSMMDLRLSLHEIERELITHGITTMFHSLSFYKSLMFDVKPIRDPENFARLVELVSESHHEKHLIRHRIHARYEIDNLDRIEELKTFIQSKKIHMVSFMDHTPGQGQFKDVELFVKTLRGYRNLDDQEIENIVASSQQSPKLTLEVIREIAELARIHQLPLASHDDDTVDKLELVRSYGSTISEFPITLDTALHAKKLGMETVAGAPNILLGGSHSGNLSAADAVKADAVTILCSDYYPAALIHAIFQLHEEFGMPLHEMVNLVTRNPARAVNMEDQIGTVEIGKKADLLIVERLDDHFPAVTTAIVNGLPVYRTHYRR